MKVLVYDANWLAYKSFITKFLVTTSGKDTSMTVGFLQDIFKFAPLLGCQKAILCWDGRNGSKRRRDVFSGYKAHRREKRKKEDFDWERFDASKKVCKTFFKKMNVPSIELEEYEGDDIVAAVCGELEHRLRLQAVVRGSDKDLVQLISKSTTVCAEEDSILTTDFYKENGIDYKGWMIERAIIGDTSDGIDGIRGLGPKRASRIAQDLKGKKNAFKYIKSGNYDNPTLKPFYDKVAPELSKISRNIKLMKLDKNLELPEVKSAVDYIISCTHPSSTEMIQLFAKYELKLLEQQLRKGGDSFWPLL